MTWKLYLIALAILAALLGIWLRSAAGQVASGVTMQGAALGGELQPTFTPTQTPTRTHTPTITPTITMTPTPSSTPTVTPTSTPTRTFTPAIWIFGDPTPWRPLPTPHPWEVAP